MWDLKRFIYLIMPKIKKLTLWKFFFSYVFRRKYIYIIGVFSLIATAISQSAHPRLIGYAIDQLNGKLIPEFFKLSSPIYTFYFLLGIYLFFHLTLFVGRWAWRRFLARETHYAGNYLRKLLWQRVQYFKQEELNSKFTPGVLMSLSASDVFSARFLFGFILMAILDVTFLFIFASLGMMQVDLELTMWMLVIMPLPGIIAWRISKLEIVAYSESKEELASFNDKVSQVITTIKLQRISGNRSFWEGMLYDMASRFRSKKLRAVLISFYFFPVMGGAILISYSLLFYFGISKVQSGVLSVGEFVSLQGFILLLQHPILDLGYIISEWQKAKASLQRLLDLFNNELDGFLLPRIAKEISYTSNPYSITNLNFAYKGKDEKQLFNKFNLTIKNGDRLGLKGEIGSGKSSLLKILAGLELGFSGEVLFRGEDIRSFAREQLAEEVTYVDQENFLFADSIRTNIALDMELSEDDLWYYLKLACVDEDIKNLEHSLDTELGEWGINLSGGQKQRVCLARALARKPSVLLLDDCLSAVDTHTELVILENLDRELKNCTVVWVAHRDSTLQKCHRIINLDER